MDIILIFLTSLGVAYLTNRFARREPLTLADIAIGVFGGFAGLSLAQLRSVEGAEWGLGLPLLITCCLSIGLESLRKRSPVH